MPEPTSTSDESRKRERVPEACTDLDLAGLEALVQELGGKRFNAGQLASWLYEHRVLELEGMTNLSKKLRAQLAERLPITTGSSVEGVEHAADDTEKVSIRLADGNLVESVIIRERERLTFCLSTQVGCAAGCRFCRSGLHGLLRNLSRGEIVEEVLHLLRLLRPGEHPTNIVFMGIGEPLDNYPGLVGALDTLRADWGFGLSPRRVTVSTVGRVKRIRQLAEEGFPVTLAVSLHAGRQETRDRLVTGGPRVDIEELVAEAKAYAQSTGRNVTFEFVVVAGENDSVEEAEALAQLVAGSHIHVNLIPVNPVTEIGMQPPDQETLHRFRQTLQDARVPVTVRKKKGDDVLAACGQLSSQLRPRS